MRRSLVIWRKIASNRIRWRITRNSVFLVGQFLPFAKNSRFHGFFHLSFLATKINGFSIQPMRERERGWGNITTFPEWDNESVQVLCIGLVYRININNPGHLFTYSSWRNASCREKRIKMFRHEGTENIGDSMLSSRSRYNFEYKCKHL